MARYLLIYLLLTSFLLQLFSQEVIVMSFELNREFISKNLCENRNRPNLHCNGKCYLAKRLKSQQQREDQETTERLQKLPSLQLFFENRPSFSFSIPVEPLVSPCFMYCFRLYVAPFAKLLRPPRL